MATVLLALTEPAIPALLKPLLDGTFVDKDPEIIFWTPFLLIILFTVRGLSNFTSGVAFEWVSGKVVLDLRAELIDQILLLPNSYFDHHSTGNTISKLTFNVTQVTNAATRVLITVVKDSIIVLGLLAYMFYLNYMMTLLILASMPVIVIVVSLLAKRLRRLSLALQESMGGLTHMLEESVRGQRVIKIFNGQAYEKKRFLHRANWVRRYNLKSKVAGLAHMPVVELIGALIFATLIFVGTRMHGGEQMSVGGFVSLLVAVGLLFSPIKRLTSINQPLQKGLAAAQTVFELVDEEPEQDLGSRELSLPKGEIDFEDVSFRYESSDRDVLRQLNFKIKAGETVALVGNSGGGKTTIMNLMPRFYQPTNGHICIDGIDIQELKLAELRKYISYVGQESVLFDDTVAANIRYGAAGDLNDEQLSKVAEAAHALEFIERLPDGFDSVIGEDGVLLSGGQRQRLAIARALAKDAPILLLDEATSALDTQSEQHVQAALRELTKGRTTLIIAHRLSTVRHANRIFVVQHGQIIEEGSHEELYQQGGQYYQLCQHQFNQPDQ